jgi:hypothetical protein
MFYLLFEVNELSVLLFCIFICPVESESDYKLLLKCVLGQVPVEDGSKVLYSLSCWHIHTDVMSSQVHCKVNLLTENSL